MENSCKQINMRQELDSPTPFEYDAFATPYPGTLVVIGKL
jgi:hypothetical protein